MAINIKIAQRFEYKYTIEKLILLYIMPWSASEIMLLFQHTGVICQILFWCTYEEIQQKKDIKVDNLIKIIQYAVH